MSEATAITSGAKTVSDAAVLSLIDMRRIDRTAGASIKRGDLTHLLKRPGGAAPPMPASVAPSVAPVAAPPPIAAPRAAPAPELPARAAFTREPAPPPVTHHASDRAPGASIKRGDLTHLLRRPSGEAPLPAAAPRAAPAPELPALAAVAREPAPPSVTPRAIDRAARTSIKRGDLTHLLKRPSGAAPPAPSTVAPAALAPANVAPANVAPAVAPVAAPPPAAAPRAAPVPALPVLAAVAPEPAAPPVVRRAVALPEPYLVPNPELKPTYIVNASAVLPPLPAPPPPAAASTSAPLSYDDVRSVDELIDYWDSLRGGRELPLFSRLDRTRIAISWPNTLMVGFDADQMPQLTRLSRLTGDVAVTSMVTEWILSCARRVARLGKAMETDRDFTSEPAMRHYQLLLLPFAGTSGASDYILCNLRRTG